MSSRRARACAALIAVCSAVLTAAPVAPAATYTVWSCRDAAGAPLPTTAWVGDGVSGASYDACDVGGHLHAELRAQDNAAGTVRGFRFALPAGALIDAYRVELAADTAAATDAGAYQSGITSDAALGVSAIDAGCLTAGCDFGTFADPLDPQNLLTATGLASRGLVLGARCASASGCNEQSGGGARAAVHVFRTQVDVRDDAAPVPLAPTPSPGAGGGLAVGASASDIGCGVAALELLVDGQVVAGHAAGGGCTPPYLVPAPCPAALATTFAIPGTGLTSGQHTAALRATDAAGNSATGPSVAIHADPPAPPVTITVEKRVEVPVPVAVPTSPAPVRIAVRSRLIGLPAKGVRVRGIVTDAGGHPLAGVRVLVDSRPFGVLRSVLRPERGATTDAAGRFSFAAIGRSRILSLDVDDDAHRAVRPVEVELRETLRVRALVRGRGLHNGSTMTLVARIQGAGAGAGGKTVLIQAIVGGRWSTVASLITGRDGLAVWRYTFRGTTRPALYRFRARVERAGDVWPWPTTDSPAVQVAVAP